MAELKTFDPLEAVLEVLTLVSAGARNEQVRRSLARLIGTVLA